MFLRFILLISFIPCWNSLLAQDPCDPPLSASISVSGAVCAGESVTLTFNVPDSDDDDFNIRYNIGGNAFEILDVMNGQTATHIVTSNTTVTLVSVLSVDDDEPDEVCITFINQTINITISNPNLTLTPADPSCGLSNGSLTANASNGTSPYQFSIDGVNFQNSNVFTNLSAGTYTVTVSDFNNCTDTQTATLTNPDAPTLTVTTMNPTCGNTDGSITINATGGVTPYQYSLDGLNFQAGNTFTNLAANEYTVVVKGSNSCSATQATTLFDPGNNLPQANIQSNLTEGCTNSSFELIGNLPNGTTGIWTCDEYNPITPTNPNWNFNNVPAGNLEISWTLSAPGCPNYDVASISVEVLPPPVAVTDQFEAGQSMVEAPVLMNDAFATEISVAIVKGPKAGTAQIDGQNNINYTPLPDAAGLDTVEYQICYSICDNICDTAIVVFRNRNSNDNPCLVDGDTSSIFTNGITPNGDDINDVLFFEIVSIENCQVNYTNNDIIIYNRWGDVVFEQMPYLNKWSGKHRNGEDLPPGVYYFVLRITTEARRYTQFGSVIIIR
jgi:large repetitive protein